MEYKIALIPGDGIGPEIINEAKKVLEENIEVIFFFWFKIIDVLMWLYYNKYYKMEKEVSYESRKNAFSE